LGLKGEQEMLIERRGTERNHGLSRTELRSPWIRWDSKSSRVRLFSSKAKDFRTKANHDYRVYVSVEEVGEALMVLAGAISTEAGPKIAETLAPHLTSILRIATACSESLDKASYTDE
jgi:hypothetical protein